MNKPFLTFTNALVAKHLLEKQSALATDIARSGNISFENASNMRSYRMALCDAVAKKFADFNGEVPLSHKAFMDGFREGVSGDTDTTQALGVIDGDFFIQSDTFIFCLDESGDTTTIIEQEGILSELEQDIAIFNYVNEKEFIQASLYGYTSESINTICLNFESISQEERDANRLLEQPKKVYNLSRKDTGFYNFRLGDQMNQCINKNLEVMLNPTKGIAILFSQSQQKNYGTLGALAHAFAIDQSIK